MVKVQVEVDTLDQLEETLGCQVDAVLLDNMTPATLAEATRVQTTLGTNGNGRNGERVGRDAAVMFDMRWRLGYHGAFTSAGILPRGFGHFGFGGSGAWADPDSGLAVAMILNQIGGSPFGDTKMLRIGGAAVRAAKRR